MQQHKKWNFQEPVVGHSPPNTFSLPSVLINNTLLLLFLKCLPLDKTNCKPKRLLRFFSCIVYMTVYLKLVLDPKLTGKAKLCSDKHSFRSIVPNTDTCELSDICPIRACSLQERGLIWMQLNSRKQHRLKQHRLTSTEKEPSPFKAGYSIDDLISYSTVRNCSQFRYQPFSASCVPGFVGSCSTNRFQC